MHYSTSLKHTHPKPPFWALTKLILAAERRFYVAVMIYGIVISLFTLAIPISVQALISSVTNTMLLRPVVILSLILLGLLLFASALNALQIYIMEMMERHIYARITRDMTLRLLYSDPTALENMNRTSLANRYFEIMHIQKIIPSLLVRGFALVLQASVGLILVSFYHPFLFILNLATFVILWFIWRIWKGSAFPAAVEVSNAKYETARVLSEISRSNPLFRSEQSTRYACENANIATASYISNRRRFFRKYFAQHIGFLFVYAIGSAALLGIGGWLVIKEQLTIGQLVAAELIMSAIFYSITRLAYHLYDLYELYASCYKISEFYRLPVQPVQGNIDFPAGEAGSLEMQDVMVKQRDEIITFNFIIPAGAKVMVNIHTQHTESVLLRLIRKQLREYKGRIAINGVNLMDIDARKVQDGIVIVDNHHMMESTVREWLELARQDISQDEILEILKIVELDKIIHALPEGLDTPLRPYGYPLHFSEMMRLKLASALLARPPMLIINGLFDSIHHSKRARIMQRIHQLPMTFIYCSNGQYIEGFDYYMHMSATDQQVCTTMQEYERMCE